MLTGNHILIIRYVLLKIYYDEWKPGDKILSTNQLQIKLNVPRTTVKDVLQRLVNSGFLVAKNKVGFWVNSEIYDVIPLSLQRRYKLKISQSKFTVTKKQQNYIVHKEYFDQANILRAYVDSKMTQKYFDAKTYNFDKSFLWNLAYYGQIVFEIQTTCVFVIDQAKRDWIKEERILYGVGKVIIATEVFYIDASIWKSSHNVKVV